MPPCFRMRYEQLTICLDTVYHPTPAAPICSTNASEGDTPINYFREKERGMRSFPIYERRP